MRRIDLGQEGIAQFDCYGERTDEPNRQGLSLEKAGETWVILGDEDRDLIAAALALASDSRCAELKARRDADPEFSGSALDVANSVLVERFGELGSQFEGMLPSRQYDDVVERAVQMYLPPPRQ